jgi:hypothetical protein
MLAALREAQQEAQTEKVAADIALIEATARSSQANEAATRLDSAVAALTGEIPVRPPSQPLIIEDTRTGESITGTPVPGDVITGQDARRDMTPEEFDADRVQRQRKARRKAKLEAEANNPYSHLKCSGCGTLGTLNDTVMQAPSGATVRMMVCSGCNNQIMS